MGLGLINNVCRILGYKKGCLFLPDLYWDVEESVLRRLLRCGPHQDTTDVVMAAETRDLFVVKDQISASNPGYPDGIWRLRGRHPPTGLFEYDPRQNINDRGALEQV